MSNKLVYLLVVYAIKFPKVLLILSSNLVHLSTVHKFHLKKKRIKMTCHSVQNRNST